MREQGIFFMLCVFFDGHVCLPNKPYCLLTTYVLRLTYYLLLITYVLLITTTTENNSALFIDATLSMRMALFLWSASYYNLVRKFKALSAAISPYH